MPKPIRHLHPPETKLSLMRAYVRGENTLRILAQKHNVPYGTAHGWCYDEHWPTQRRQFIAEAKRLMQQPEPKANLTPRSPEEHETRRQLVKVHTLFAASKSATELKHLAGLEDRLHARLFFFKHGHWPATTAAKQEHGGREKPESPLPPQPKVMVRGIAKAIPIPQDIVVHPPDSDADSPDD